VKGILTLGKFLIWLAIFLFFYSSFLVLFQFGSKNYVTKMTSGWGSVAQEFQTSFRTLTAPVPVGSRETSAPSTAGTAGTTSGADTAKPGEIPGHVTMLIWGSVVVCLLGFFWIVAVAFQESMLWGLGVLFIPGLFIIYWLTHFREATPPFILWAIGFVVQFFIFSHYGIDFHDYFLGTPPELKPQPGNPLEGMIMFILYFLFC
jgi:hypothetical protein